MLNANVVPVAAISYRIAFDIHREGATVPSSNQQRPSNLGRLSRKLADASHFRRDQMTEIFLMFSKKSPEKSVRLKPDVRRN